MKKDAIYPDIPGIERFFDELLNALRNSKLDLSNKRLELSLPQYPETDRFLTDLISVIQDLRRETAGLLNIDSDGTIEIRDSNNVIRLTIDNEGTTKQNDGAIQVSSLTTTERDALTAVNGMIIYNETTNKFQGYENGSWANLI